MSGGFRQSIQQRIVGYRTNNKFKRAGTGAGGTGARVIFACSPEGDFDHDWIDGLEDD